MVSTATANRPGHVSCIEDPETMNISARQVYLVLKQAAERGDDEELTLQMRRDRAEGFAWRYDGLDDWPTETILAKLRELGIDTDADRFAEQAQSAERCMVLYEKWLQDLDPDLEDTFWEDFALLASHELWRRLAPNVPCPEMVSDRLEAVLRRSDTEEDGPTSEEDRAEIDAAMLAMDYLERFDRQDRESKFQELLGCGLYEYGEWLLDLVANCGQRFPDEATRIADIMSDFRDGSAFQSDLAWALAWAGRREEALQRVKANLERFSGDVWTRINAGDVYEKLGDNEKALALCVGAMKMTSDPEEWDAAEERVPELLAKMGRAEEWSHIKRECPKPVDRPSTSSVMPEAIGRTTDDVPDSPTPRGEGPKIGRNDPCPCGSGKKYKKCCMRRS